MHSVACQYYIVQYQAHMFSNPLIIPLTFMPVLFCLVFALVSFSFSAYYSAHDLDNNHRCQPALLQPEAFLHSDT